MNLQEKTIEKEIKVKYNTVVLKNQKIQRRGIIMNKIANMKQRAQKMYNCTPTRMGRIRI